MSLDLTDSLQVLAGTIYGEARGDLELGQEAIACVVQNRINKPCWWGHDILSVCLKPYQFSCWNENDVNRLKIIQADLDKNWDHFLDIANRSVQQNLFDPTDGCDSYFDARINTPVWARNLKPHATIGHHVFFITRP